jgi:hypothetical protein
VILSARVATVRSFDVMLETVVQDGTAIVLCRGRVLHGATARRFRGCIGDVLSERQLVLAAAAGRLNYLLPLTRLDTLVDCVPSYALRDAPESAPVGHLVST